MNLKTISWVLLIVIIDTLLIGYLMNIIVLDGNDKAIIQYFYYYPLIVIANTIVWLFCRKTKLSKPLIILILFLVIFFYPLITLMF
jgi:hypothetical protein